MSRILEMMQLPIPSCPMGYTDDDLKEILGTTLPDFRHWMRGQTYTLCEGRRFNHELRTYEPSECSDHPHGPITYVHDVHAYLKGLPPLD